MNYYGAMPACKYELAYVRAATELPGAHLSAFIIAR